MSEITSPKMSIRGEIQNGMRAQGAELVESDVGRPLDFLEMGDVLPIDIGKRVWLRTYGVTMESNEQRDKRKGVKK